jgi:DNA-binding LytR/AlgR family response regulator
METESRQIVIHTVNGQLETYMPLSKLLEMLPVSMFARITRFEAVSLLHTSGINKDVLLLDNGEKRTISEKMLSEVTEAYHDHKKRA